MIADAISIQAEWQRALHLVEVLEREILSITDQLEEAPESRKGSQWWVRASAALVHKEKERRILVARGKRLERRLQRIDPQDKKAQAKRALKVVLKALFMVAKTGLDYYEHEGAGTETAFTDALDHLDQVAPGWEEGKLDPQENGGP